MTSLIRLLAGRRLIVLVLLGALAAAASPALREKASRLIACSVSVEAADLFEGAGKSAVDAMTGGRVASSSPRQCLREALHTTAAARSWVRRRSRLQ